jgi:hypothetical protein
MIVVIPRTLTDGMITDTDAPNSSSSDYAGLVTWTSTNYSVNQYVLHTPTQNIYRANDNVSHTDVPSVSTKWTLIARNNPYRLIDGKINSPTVKAGGFFTEFTISGNIVDSLAGFGIAGVESITISVAGTSYSRTIQMQDNTAIIDWWAYYFSPVISKDKFVVYDLPAKLDAAITAEFNSTTTASIGEIVIGNRRTLGTAIHGSGFSNADLSRVEYDEFGNVTGKIIRPNIDTVDYDVKLETSSIGYARNTLKSIGKTTECVWAGSNAEDDDLLCYGFYEDFSVVISYPTVSDCSIKVRTLA